MGRSAIALATPIGNVVSATSVFQGSPPAVPLACNVNEFTTSHHAILLNVALRLAAHFMQPLEVPCFKERAETSEIVPQSHWQRQYTLLPLTSAFSKTVQCPNLRPMRFFVGLRIELEHLRHIVDWPDTKVVPRTSCIAPQSHWQRQYTYLCLLSTLSRTVQCPNLFPERSVIRPSSSMRNGWRTCLHPSNTHVPDATLVCAR